VVIDDLGIIAEVPLDSIDETTVADWDLSARADAVYKAAAWPQAMHKATKGEAVGAELWGAWIEGKRGRVSVHPAKRATLSALTLLALGMGLNGDTAQSLVGSWGFCISFKRVFLSVMDVIYTWMKKLQPRVRVPVGGPACDELLALALLSPLMEADLRLPLCKLLGAVDASSSGAGAAVASVSSQTAIDLYGMAEDRGAHVRLDWQNLPPPLRLRDHRVAVARVVQKYCGQWSSASRSASVRTSTCWRQTL
jgi:hypothetical protein